MMMYKLMGRQDLICDGPPEDPTNTGKFSSHIEAIAIDFLLHRNIDQLHFWKSC